MFLTQNKLIAGFLLTSTITGINLASAETRWQRNHPERAELNLRLRDQNRRIHEERREGKITNAQAMAMHANLRSIHTQENITARRNHAGGHLNGRQVHNLDQDLNASSKTIGQ